jgi:hypothetical protein
MFGNAERGALFGKGNTGRSDSLSAASPSGRTRRSTMTTFVAPSASPNFDEASPVGKQQFSPIATSMHASPKRQPSMSGVPQVSSRRDILEASVPRTDGDMELISALRKHVNHLEEETMVREGLAVSLGRSVLSMRTRCGDLEQRSVTLESTNTQLRNALAISEAQLQEVCRRSSTLEVSAKERDALAAKVASVKSLEDQVAALKSQNEALEAQMTDWKSKVKDALREGKKREQQLTSSSIVFQTEIKQLQEKLNEASFQLQVTSALQSKQRASRESQTDLSGVAQSDLGDGNPLSMSYGGSPLANEGSINIGRRRRSMLRSEGRDRAGSVVFSPTMLPPGLSVTGPENRPVSPSHATHLSPPQPMNMGESYTRGESPALLPVVPTLNFPLPLPPLSPHALQSPSGPTSPRRPEDPSMQPAAPPFIVTVHFSTPDGWSIDAKQRVPRGMTVEGLMQQCAQQFSARYQQDIQVDHMFIRMNHEKVKRSVILHRDRELHSFAIFQRYQREGTAIVLFLAPRDDMSEYVQLKLQQRLAEEMS